jgi:hypothetical protein
MATKNTRSADPVDFAERAFAPFAGLAQGWAESVERGLRFQQAVAGDWFEFGIEHLRAATTTREPGTLLARQAEINTKFGEQAGKRSQELLKLATEQQATVARLIEDSQSGWRAA